VTASLLQAAHALMVVGLAVLGIVHFGLFCLTDLARTPDHHLRGLNYQDWPVVIFSLPLGRHPVRVTGPGTAT
jgi:hypothetical protein